MSHTVVLFVVSFVMLFVWAWDPISRNSMGNLEAAGVSSERRCSSCSSLPGFTERYPV